MMDADDHGNKDVRKRVAHVVQTGAEVTLKSQLLGQDSIQIIHEVVEDDQRTEISDTIVQKKNTERQHTKY